MATIKEVAKQAGLSVSCVSKYLNHPEDVLPETKEKIDAAIATLGYAPSPMARSLRTKRTNIVIVIAESIINPFFAEIYDCISKELEIYGYRTMLQTFSERKFCPGDFAYADGIIICFPDDDSRIDSIHKAAGDIPIVLMHGHEVEQRVPTVMLNVGKGSRSAVDYLYQAGCRSFIIVGGSETSSMSCEKNVAIKRYLSEHSGVSLRNYTGENSYRGGMVAIKKAEQYIKDTDAILCESDALATGVISAIYDLGLEVPRDIKVVGYDDIPLASMFKPRITTVAIPGVAMSASASEMIRKLIQREKCENQTFDPELIVRQTT